MVTEYQVSWTGPGGPGVSTFHTVDVTGSSEAFSVSSRLQAMFDVLANYLPNEVQTRGPAEAKTLDTATGALVAVHPISAPWVSTGQSNGSYNRAAGARWDWLTAALVGGRRLRGRTYAVPLVAAAFDGDGAVLSSVASSLRTAAETLIAGNASANVPLQVWSRTHGVARDVVGVTVPPLGAVLRSRRD